VAIPTPPNAIELKCASCSGAFEPTALAPRVRCPFCGHEQAIELELLTRLDGYRERILDQVDAIADERRQAERYDAWYGRMRRGSPRLVLAMTVIFMLVPTLFGLAMWALVSLFGPAAEGLMPLLPIPLMLTVFAAIAGWTVWLYSGKRQRRRTSELGAAALACPGCGAVSRIEPGERATACAFCGASLLPPEPVMGQSLAAAERAEVEARLQRYRAEREGIVKVYSYSAQGYVHWMVLGPFALMTGGGAVVFSVEMVSGREPFSPGIFLIWAMFFGCVAIAAGITIYRRVQGDRWNAALAAVARSSGGRALAGIDGLASWLDAHWAGPYDLRFLYAGSFAHGAALTADGYPGLLWIDPTAASQHHPARAHLFVAAWIPGVANEDVASIPSAARPLLTELRREHDVELQEGGLFVSLDAQEVKRLRRDPSRVTALAPLFGRLASLARALGATPVAPD
jgi:hypothetical protein